MIRGDVTVWRRASGGASAILVGSVGAPAAEPRTDVFSAGPDAFAYLREAATHPRGHDEHQRPAP